MPSKACRAGRAFVPASEKARGSRPGEGRNGAFCCFSGCYLRIVWQWRGWARSAISRATPRGPWGASRGESDDGWIGTGFMMGCVCSHVFSSLCYGSLNFDDPFGCVYRLLCSLGGVLSFAPAGEGPRVSRTNDNNNDSNSKHHYCRACPCLGRLPFCIKLRRESVDQLVRGKAKLERLGRLTPERLARFGQPL